MTVVTEVIECGKHPETTAGGVQEVLNKIATAGGHVVSIIPIQDNGTTVAIIVAFHQY